MKDPFQKLRLQRLKHRISRRELAQVLGCHENWLSQLENHGYRGPAAGTWAEKYQAALNELIEKRRAGK